MSDVQYLDIPLDQLHDSPFQTRLSYDEVYIAGLADDIKFHKRNLQMILARPRIPELFQGTNDPNAITGYEIVFGHCRKRAIALAGLATARCEVRAMTDKEAERALISENLKRKDIHPFEEAQGFRRLIDAHGITADDIAAETGQSRTYVYSRLKLLQACDEVRKACIAREIDAEVALLIARLRSDKLQAKALARIKAKYWDLKDGGKKSYRSIRELLNEEFTLDLEAAPFPIDATNLAGAGACPTCPKRSANAPEYQDVAEDRKTHRYSRQNLGPNVCTDPTCFAAKKVAHFKNEADNWRKAGREVVDGNRARTAVSATGEVKGGYLPLNQVKAELQRAKLAAQGSGGKIPMPAAVLIQDPRTGKTFEAVKESELIAAGTRKAVEKSSKSAPVDRRQEDYEAKRKREEDEAERLSAKRLEWLKRVRAAASATTRSTFDLRLALDRMLELISCEPDEATLIKLYEVDGIEVLRDRLPTMTADELGLLLLDCALVRYVEVDRWELDEDATALTSAALHYDIEPPTATPSTAARAQEEGTDDGDDEGDEAAAATNTPSTAALAPAEASTKQPAAGALQPVKAWPFPMHPPAAKTKSQAGSAGKDVKGAGSAGVSSSSTPAVAGGVAAEA